MNIFTLRFLRCFNFFRDLESLSGVDDIDDCTRSSCFEIFQKCPGIAAICIRRIYTLCREIVEFLEIRIPTRG